MNIQEFTTVIKGLKPTFQARLADCPAVTPTSENLIQLKGQLLDGKTFFLSMGQDGSLDFIENCAMYGLLDKNNLPEKPRDWIALVNGLLTNIEMSQRGNQVVNKNVVNRSNVNVSLPNQNTISNESLIPNANEIVNITVETGKKALSWWETPLFSPFGVDLTPTRILLGYVGYYGYKKYKARRGFND